MCLPAANSGNDFKNIAFLNLAGCEMATRNDFTVPLKRNALAGQPHFIDQ